MDLTSYGIESLEVNDQRLYRLASVCEYLGLKSSGDVVPRLAPRHLHRLRISRPYGSKGATRKQLVYFLTWDGLKQVILKSNKPNAVRLSRNLGWYGERRYLQESDTVLEIQTALAPFKSETQYWCGGPRVDLYFPDQRVAVECDEHHHSKSSAREKDLERQEAIEKELGCTFVRYRPDEDIFGVIGRVLTELLRSR